MPPPKTLLRAVAILGTLALAGQSAFSRTGTATSVTSVQVQRGDTLWGLSKRYGIPVDRLAAVNHMKQSDILFAGRTLQLAAVRPAAAPRPPSTSTKATRNFCSTYVPPSGPRGALPADLLAHRDRLALRPVFAKWSKAYGVPVDLVEAEAWQESGWQNNVISSADARGIGQLLPETAAFVNRQLGTNLKMTVPEDNVRMMAAYLAYLLTLNGGQVCGAVVSYYQGFGALQRVGVLPESQVYVRSVLATRLSFH